MTRRLPFTEYSLRRAIAAAQKAGLRITGIRPDGTLIVRENTDAAVDSPLYERAATGSKWEDVQA
jgi:hypothetical protein